MTTRRPLAGTVPAPDFPDGLDWFNTGRPLKLADLRGKIVLLDFWTYGCINCVHVIPDLKRLEERYRNELVVIGVHSAKFANEGDSDNIRRILLRYEITHPVVNDKDFKVWRQYGVRAWPSFVIIDPHGKVVGRHAGEGVYALFDGVIAQLVGEFEGRIDRRPLEFKLEREGQPDSPLRFPGKVLADEASGRLFTADANHNRIVVADLEGQVLEVIGSGKAALEDGDYVSAGFSRPQGMTLANEHTLYVADTENHALRRVDLGRKTVTTVAGRGEQRYMRFMEAPARQAWLNSPWDVLYHDGLVYIAMAGQHQLWRYDPERETLHLHAGSGREALEDGPMLTAALNQPSGLATDGVRLYLADSEASAVRSADFDPAGDLRTVVGTGLFDFGDADGVGDGVRLQHPLGLVYSEGALYLADTYNSKIKRLDPETRASASLFGGDRSGWRDGEEALFDEPGGISVANGALYIADTNNHVVRVADLSTKGVRTLVLVDKAGQLSRYAEAQNEALKVVTLEPQTVGMGKGKISLELSLPEGVKLNDLAPLSFDWRSDSQAVRLGDRAKGRVMNPAFPLDTPALFTGGKALLTGDLVITYCEAAAKSLCYLEHVRLVLPVTVQAEGGDTVRLRYRLGKERT